MNEVMEMKNVNVTQELLMTLMGGDDDLQKLHGLRRIMRNRELEPIQMMELAYEYLGYALGKNLPKENKPIAAEIIAGPDLNDIKPPIKHNRVPFEKKMEIINIYLNNPFSYKKIADITGVNCSTVTGIIRNYKTKHPEMVEQAKK